MVILSVGTFVSSFILPTKGLLALLGALAGIGVMAWAASGRKPLLLRVAGLAGGLVLAVALTRMAPTFRKVGTGFFPIDDRSEFNVRLETPPGSSLAYTRAKAERIDAMVRTLPEVRYSYTTLGGGTSGAVDVGTMYVRLTPKADRERSAEDVAAVEHGCHTHRALGARALRALRAGGRPGHDDVVRGASCARFGLRRRP